LDVQLHPQACPRRFAGEDQTISTGQTEVLASVVEAVPLGDPRVVALSEQIETLSAIVELMQEHKAALLAEGSAMSVVAANQ